MGQHGWASIDALNHPAGVPLFDGIGKQSRSTPEIQPSTCWNWESLAVPG
jgi:hypothetical protein